MVRSGFWRDFWSLFKPYWFSNEKGVARLLLCAIIGLTLAGVYMDVQFNDWYNLFYNSLQDKNKPEFLHQMVRFCILAAIYIVIGVYATYLNQMLQVRWRRWLTDHYLKEWLEQRNYYRMQLTGTATDNPDQRVSEDLRLFVDETLSLTLGLLNAVVTLIAFAGILWKLSGTLEFTLFGQPYLFYGYMVWVALAYAIIGTWCAHRIGRPLVHLNFEQQRFEANFRFALVRFRENMEGVALYRGEADELRGFRERFAAVFSNWWAIMKRQKILNFFRYTYNQLAVIFPFLVGAPRFFSGAIQLGGLMQISNAFGKVQDSLSWFINVYSGAGPNTGFVGWKATVDRLTGFHSAIVSAQQQHITHPGIAHDTETLAGDLQLQNVELDLPDGKPLLADASLTIGPGARVLIQGTSGCGKSTLFRAIAGIWPFGRGRIRRPQHFDALFLPQRPYFPLGTLREALCYPGRPETFVEREIQRVLIATGLGHLEPRLDETASWSAQLSGGEQQRVAVARALLLQPAWLFLDEATSSLDDVNQAELYDLLTQELTRTTIVSIGHRHALADYHSRRVEVLSTPGEINVLRELDEEPA